MRRILQYLALPVVLLVFAYYYLVNFRSTVPLHPAAESKGRGYYDTTLRPQIHFSSYRHWINDPNGLFIDSNNVWHMYYQCKRPFLLET